MAAIVTPTYTHLAAQKLQAKHAAIGCCIYSYMSYLYRSTRTPKSTANSPARPLGHSCLPDTVLRRDARPWQTPKCPVNREAAGGRIP